MAVPKRMSRRSSCRPAQLRALIIAEADLGERLVRALILRRVALIESGASGPVLIGQPQSADVLRLESFLRRNGQPHHVVDASVDVDAAALVEQYGAAASEPLVVCPDGTVLRQPSDDALARCIGMVDVAEHDEVFDVAVVGAGPAVWRRRSMPPPKACMSSCSTAGRSAARPAPARGSKTTSAFPTGISGQALAGRAFVQAQKFGAEMMIPAQVESLDCSRRKNGDTLAIRLTDGRRFKARTVVVASGARYRRPAVPRLGEFEGRGVWYWASPIEAKMCAQAQVALVGGGNSAGQAAVFLAQHAARIFMLIRGPSLAASMSRYLIDRIEATPNIELKPHTEITGLHGQRDSGLEAVTWRHRETALEERFAIRNLFLFVGADPETHWLADCGVAMDVNGFVITGPSAGGAAPRSEASALESSIAGVFAVGDVRSGSVKRVGGAIGEGAAVVAQIHQHLSRERSSGKGP